MPAGSVGARASTARQGRSAMRSRCDVSMQETTGGRETAIPQTEDREYREDPAHPEDPGHRDTANTPDTTHSPEPSEKSARRRTWRRVLRRGLTVGVFVVLAGAVAWALRGQDWSALVAVVEDRHPGYFALVALGAMVVNALGVVLSMMAWRAVLSGVGERLGAVAAARIFFVGQFAKYVPGKVFGAVVTVQMGRSVGVPTVRMVSAWLLTLIVATLTGATVGLAVAFHVLDGSAYWLALAGVPVVAVLVRPALVDRAALVAARVLRRPPPSAQVSGRGVRRAVVAQLGAWLVGGLHLWLLAVVMGADPVPALPLSVGAFSLAAIVGMVAVFAPDGIGVREVVLLAALSVTLPVPVASVVVLVSRVVVTLSEMLAAGVGLLVTEILRRRRPDAQHGTPAVGGEGGAPAPGGEHGAPAPGGDSAGSAGLVRT